MPVWVMGGWVGWSKHRVGVCTQSPLWCVQHNPNTRLGPQAIPSPPHLLQAGDGPLVDHAVDELQVGAAVVQDVAAAVPHVILRALHVVCMGEVGIRQWGQLGIRLGQRGTSRGANPRKIE